MANLIAIAFPDPSKAFELRAKLVELQKEYLLEMEDIVVVTRDEQGKVKLHQPVNLTAAGAAGGGFWGMLIGMLFLNPLIGFVVGAGAGTLTGYMSDIGINDNFTKRLASELKPGGAAVFVLVRKATGDKVLDRLTGFAGTGTIMQTSLSKDNEEAVRKVFEKTPGIEAPSSTVRSAG